MRNLLTIWGVTALFLVVAQATADDKDKPVKDKASDSLKLEGDYTIVSGEKFGQKEPEERIKGTMVHISADKISVTDKDKKETFVASYTVDTTIKPHLVTMIALAPKKGVVAKGLIEKEGDTVRLIYALPDGDLPKEFMTKDKQLLFVMKSVKK